MADNIVKRGFEEFDRGTIENIAEYLSPEELYWMLLTVSGNTIRQTTSL